MWLSPSRRPFLPILRRLCKRFGCISAIFSQCAERGAALGPEGARCSCCVSLCPFAHKPWESRDRCPARESGRRAGSPRWPWSPTPAVPHLRGQWQHLPPLVLSKPGVIMDCLIHAPQGGPLAAPDCAPLSTTQRSASAAPRCTRLQATSPLTAAPCLPLSPTVPSQPAATERQPAPSRGPA